MIPVKVIGRVAMLTVTHNPNQCQSNHHQPYFSFSSHIVALSRSDPELSPYS